MLANISWFSYCKVTRRMIMLLWYVELLDFQKFFFSVFFSSMYSRYSAIQLSTTMLRAPLMHAAIVTMVECRTLRILLWSFCFKHLQWLQYNADFHSSVEGAMVVCTTLGFNSRYSAISAFQDHIEGALHTCISLSSLHYCTISSQSTGHGIGVLVLY